jgi:hypothetical protein
MRVTSSFALPPDSIPANEPQQPVVFFAEACRLRQRGHTPKDITSVVVAMNVSA